MVSFLIKAVFLFIIVSLTNIISYKYIRYIDKKTRKKIDKYELNQVDKLIEKFEKIGVKNEKLND